MLVYTMAKTHHEPLGSMGADVPLACLSKLPRSVYDYLYQLFAQATNPAIDPLRECNVMSRRQEADWSSVWLGREKKGEKEKKGKRKEEKKRKRKEKKRKERGKERGKGKRKGKRKGRKRKEEDKKKKDF